MIFTSSLQTLIFLSANTHLLHMLMMSERKRKTVHVGDLCSEEESLTKTYIDRAATFHNPFILFIKFTSKIVQCTISVLYTMTLCSGYIITHRKGKCSWSRKILPCDLVESQ